MEYQFTRTVTGDYHIKCSMGHEIIGRWLQEDISNDRQALKSLLSVISEIKAGVIQEHLLQGKEISVSLFRDEVIVEENVLANGEELDAESEFDFYDCESSAACGLEDFEELLLSWADFI